MVRRHDRGGFTLVELLVVIGIIVILAALLMPSLTAARVRAREASCMGNLHQMAIAMEIYNLHQPLLVPYLSGLVPDMPKEAFICPADATDGREGGKPTWDPGRQYPETDELPTNRAGELAFEQEHYGADAYKIEFDGAINEPYKFRNSAVEAGSYIYEFTVARCPFGSEWGDLPDQIAHRGNGDGIVSWREYKDAVEGRGLKQDGTYDRSASFPSCVPVVRCFHHTTTGYPPGEETVLNLGGHYGVYRSDPTATGWQTSCKPGADDAGG